MIAVSSSTEVDRTSPYQGRIPYTGRAFSPGFLATRGGSGADARRVFADLPGTIMKASIALKHRVGAETRDESLHRYTELDPLGSSVGSSVFIRTATKEHTYPV